MLINTVSQTPVAIAAAALRIIEIVVPPPALAVTQYFGKICKYSAIISA